MTADPTSLVRHLIRVSGIVQGVGFRPFAHALAQSLPVTGRVRNTSGGVAIEVQGPEAAVRAFADALTRRTPPGARIERVAIESLLPRPELDFVIEPSVANEDGEIAFAPDVATCDECLADVNDASSRWSGYPFTCCSACGPRFTVLESGPYDREQTTLRQFPLCAACEVEYASASSRRFHAQGIACATCGPTVGLCDATGVKVESPDPLAQAAAWIAAGRIGALKGIGGFHLVCDAANLATVMELRRRKRRDEKPLAVMVESVADAARRFFISAHELAWLQSPARPIVLLRKRPNTGLAAGISPGLAHTGVMLPYSPLHALMLKAGGGRPLVMTSGNATDEPIVFRDDEARTRLPAIADFILTHNRDIVRRCDDSVVRLAGPFPILVRRSRGYAPSPLSLPFRVAMPTLAVGAQLKAVFALGEDRRAIVSHHIGDLDDYETLADYGASIAQFERLFRIKPRRLVHDLHPDYASTRYALRRATRDGLPAFAVQHHHAHFASCLADNGATGPAIGVCLDGTGYGPDGAIWGGEFLVGDCRAVERAAHLRYVPMPGGEAAIREPWRMAAAYLTDADLNPAEILRAIPPSQLQLVGQMIAQRINSPASSSAGRFFDAMAALLGLRHRVAYEGQAAMELEALALASDADGAYEFAFDGSQPLVIDLRPLVRGVVQEIQRRRDSADIARRIHTTLVLMIETLSRRVADQCGLGTVALSGGVFMNALLLEQTSERLTAAGFQVLRHTRVPPNDGGISLGQLAVAAAQPE